MDDVLHNYLSAVRRGDRKAAWQVVAGAQAGGRTLRDLYLDVFQPALREIGKLWEQNEVTVAEEHLATAITQTTMARLYTGAALPEESGLRLVAACPEFERHEVGLRMLCDFMDLEGWSTTFLGASVPAHSLARMVCEQQPHVVALSASITPHLVQLRSTIADVRTACGQPAPLILVGGRVFHHAPELARQIGADLTAHDARSAAQLLVEHFSA
jgi:methanogenic corrinoid protein MtbC1